MSAITFRVAVPSVLLLSLSATVASSQVLGVATSLAGFGASPNACPASPSYAALGSEAIADWALARVSWSGTVASALAASPARQGTISAQVLSPEWRGWRLDASTLHGFGSSPCLAKSSLRQHAAGVSYGSQRSGVSLHYLKRLTRDATGSPADTLSERILGPTTRGISFSAWHNVGRTLLSVSLGSRSRWREERRVVQVTSGPDTVPTDSGPVIIPGGPSYQTRVDRGLLHAFGTELRLGWASGRLAFDVQGGHALGGKSPAEGRFWSRSDASIALTPSIAVVSGIVLDDGWDSRRLMPRRYVTLGARLTSAPFSRPTDAVAYTSRAAIAAFRVETSEAGVVTLGIRAANARLVELTGDFVQWRAVRMQRVSTDWWELRMRMSPGVHRVNVRVDGGSWSAPPGLQRQRDEFGGDAGVFVIP